MRGSLLVIAIAAAVVGASAAVIVGALAGGGGDDDRRVLVAAGRALERVEPDTATVRLGASARAASAGGAMRRASTALEAVIAATRRAGAEEIRTLPARLRRAPERERDVPAPDPEAAAPDPEAAAPARRGFIASQTILVRVAEPAGAAEIIDGAVAAGATEVSGPDFALADPAAAQRRVTAEAVADARRTAEAMAKAAGLRLGRPVRVQHRGAAVPLPAGLRAADAAAETRTPVVPGTIDVESSVEVTFEAEPR